MRSVVLHNLTDHTKCARMFFYEKNIYTEIHHLVVGGDIRADGSVVHNILSHGDFKQQAGLREVFF